MMRKSEENIGTIAAVPSTSYIVARRLRNVLHVMMGFGSVCIALAMADDADPVISGLSFEHADANRSMAARVSSCS